MAFRNVYVANDVKLKTKAESLIITKGKDEYKIPLEDINSVCIESQDTYITTYTLRKLIEHDIILYVCNEKHLPSGFLIGMNNYSRQLKNIQMQIEMPKPLVKRIWQQIVQNKIANQARCLEELEINQYKLVENMIEQVNSGDSTNIEAQAAAIYFKALFGNKFNRDIENVINASLNYGYAIVRGVIARTLVMYGFETSIGLFHHNQLNSFNLADDMIECFRPIVDLYVIKNMDLTKQTLESKDKQVLYNVVNELVLIDGKKFNIYGAVEYMIKSLSTSMNQKENLIKLPKLIKLEQYRYA